MIEMFIPKYQDYGSIDINVAEKRRISLRHLRKCWKYRIDLERSRKPGRQTIDDINIGFLMAWDNPLQLGLDLLNPGGFVYMPAGTYTFTDTTNNIPCNNVRISGAGSASILKAAKTASASKEILNIEGTDNIKISDLYFDGNAATIYAAGFASEHDHCINIQDSENVIISNCAIVNPCGDGIMILGKTGENSKYITIDGCYIKVTSQDKATSIGRNCIAVTDNCERINITNNQLIGGYPAAIDIEPATDIDYTVDGVIVANNNIDTPNGYGINVQSTCQTAGKTVKVKNVIVKGNNINNAYDCGIKTWGIETAGTVECENVNVEGNSLVGCIDAGSSAVASIEVRGIATNIKVHNNIVRDSGKHGIYMLGNGRQDDIDIIGNQVYKSQYEGIFLDGGSGTEIDDVRVLNNVCKNNSQVGADTSDGILIKYTDRLKIAGNVCNDDQGTHTQKYGIELQNCDDISIGDWMCENNSTGPFRETGGSNYKLPNAKIVGYWEIDNVAQSVANSAMQMNGVSGQLVMPFDGYVVGISVYGNAAVTTGTVDVYLAKNGVLDSGVNAELNTSDTQRAEGIMFDTPKAFSKGDSLSCIYASSADLIPNGSLDIRACLLVMSC